MSTLETNWSSLKSLPEKKFSQIAFFDNKILISRIFLHVQILYTKHQMAKSLIIVWL